MVVYGAKVPYILRGGDIGDDGGPTYQLVGECYVNGVMQGEVLGLVERGGLRNEPIIMA